MLVLLTRSRNEADELESIVELNAWSLHKGEGQTISPHWCSANASVRGNDIVRSLTTFSRSIECWGPSSGKRIRYRCIQGFDICCLILCHNFRYPRWSWIFKFWERGGDEEPDDGDDSQKAMWVDDIIHPLTFVVGLWSCSKTHYRLYMRLRWPCRKRGSLQGRLGHTVTVYKKIISKYSSISRGVVS